MLSACSVPDTTLNTDNIAVTSKRNTTFCSPGADTVVRRGTRNERERGKLPRAECRYIHHGHGRAEVGGLKGEILDNTVSKGLHGRVTFQSRPEGGREGAVWGSAGRLFQAEGTASAEAPRRKCFWRVRGTAGGQCSWSSVSKGNHRGNVGEVMGRSCTLP